MKGRIRYILDNLEWDNKNSRAGEEGKHSENTNLV